LISVPWNELKKEDIEKTKIYIASKYPNRAKEVSEIIETEFLYKDYYGNIHFPKFLRKLTELKDSENLFVKLKPNERRGLLKREWKNRIFPILKRENIELQPFASSQFHDVEPPRFKIGKNKTVLKTNSFSIPNEARKHGFFKTSAKYNIYILDLTGKLDRDFVEKLKRDFEGFVGVGSLNVKIKHSQLSEDISGLELEKRSDVFIKNLEDEFKKENFLPLIIHCEKQKIFDSAYKYIKRASLLNGFPTQFIKLNNTNYNKAKFINIIFGIVAKYGDILYLLDKEQRFVDYFIGFDVSRKKKANGNTSNVSGGIYFFSEKGEFKSSKKIDLEGEIIRTDEVSRVFDKDKFKGKRIVIHRDGNSQKREVELLKEYFKLHDIKAHIIYITKRHTARVFNISNENAQNPKKGVFLNYAKNKALLVTSDSKIGTKRPLKIEYILLNDDSEMKFHDVVKDIFDFTYMNFGSYTDTSLPVTVHYSHQVSKFLNEGIEPSKEIFDKIYWI
jgi:hypothetical protein